MGRKQLFSNNIYVRCSTTHKKALARAMKQNDESEAGVIRYLAEHGIDEKGNYTI